MKITSPTVRQLASSPGRSGFHGLTPGDRVQARILSHLPAGKTLLQIGAAKILAAPSINGKVGEVLWLEVQRIPQSVASNDAPLTGFQFRPVGNASAAKRFPGRALPSGTLDAATRTFKTGMALSQTTAREQRPAAVGAGLRWERHGSSAEVVSDYAAGFWIEPAGERPWFARLDLDVPRKQPGQNDDDGCLKAAWVFDLANIGAIGVDVRMDAATIWVDFRAALSSTLATIETNLDGLQNALEQLERHAFCQVRLDPELREGLRAQMLASPNLPHAIELKI